MSKRTGDIELVGAIITPDGSVSGEAGQDFSIAAGAGNVLSGDGGSVNISGGAAIGTSAGQDGGDITLTPGVGVVPSGTQVVDVGGARVGGDATGLSNDATIYTASIIVDGGASQPISIVGSAAQTYTTLLSELSADTTGLVWSLTDGNILATSDTTGAVSTIAISDVTVFSQLADYVTVNAAVGAGSAGAIVIPQTVAPTSTTNKLYNDGGTLTWDGTDISAASGDVFKEGTPVNNQLAVWTGDGTLEGDSELLYDSSAKVFTIAASSGCVVTNPFGSFTIVDSNELAPNGSPSVSFNSSGGTKAAIGFFGAQTTFTSLSYLGEIQLFPAFTSGSEVVRITQGGLVMSERADHAATPAAASGELWVRNDTPNVLIFTDDAGTDTVLGSGGGGGIAAVVDDTTPQLGGALDLNGFTIITEDAADPDDIIIIGGDATSATIDGANVALSAGDGNTTGQGGRVQLTAGRGGATGDGGPVTITGGLITSNTAFGGDVTVSGGASSNAGSDNYGGNVILNGGANVNGTGGSINLNGGTSTNYDGGAVAITSGTSGGTRDGGDINITTGDGGGYGGAVNITAGDSTTDGGGGNIVLTPGAQSGGNADGAIVITATLTAPSPTTNRLYNNGGSLYWNGTDISGGGGGVTNPMTANLDVGGYSIYGEAAATATSNGGDVFIAGAAGGVASGDGGSLGLSGGNPTLGNGGNVEINASNGSGAGDNYGGNVEINAGNGTNGAYGGYVSIGAGNGGVTSYGGVVNITAGDGGSTSGVGGVVNIIAGNATSGAGGDVNLTAGEGDTADNNGAIVLETGTAGIIETTRGYIATNSTGATALIATIPLTSGDSSCFEIFAVARQDAGTESAAFRIFGAAENTGGTAALIGSTAKDRTDDGGASVDWDVVIGVSTGNLTITLDNDAETVDWKIKVRLTEL